RILRYSSEESRVFSNFFLFSSPSCVACCLLIAGQWMRIIGRSRISASVFLKKLTKRMLYKQTPHIGIKNRHRLFKKVSILSVILSDLTVKSSFIN
ncbi:hypothetical protein, partial [Proteus penneri]|uniref:hypothetical protein n=2 Tax=Proteus penneri TaxID=102862 RepID=UPI002888FC6E